MTGKLDWEEGNRWSLWMDGKILETQEMGRWEADKVSIMPRCVWATAEIELTQEGKNERRNNIRIDT